VHFNESKVPARLILIAFNILIWKNLQIAYLQYLVPTLWVTSMYGARMRAFQEGNFDDAMSALVIHIYQN
jgi:hypothetical protein